MNNYLNQSILFLLGNVQQGTKIQRLMIRYYVKYIFQLQHSKFPYFF